MARKNLKIKSSQIAYTIDEIVSGYADEKEAKLKQIMIDCAEDGVQTIKEKGSSAQGSVRKHYIDWGDYLSGWTFEEDNGTVKIKNKDKPGLTHLLEFGHEVKNKKNGPVLGSAGAYPHVMPAERLIKKNFQKKVEETFK